MTVNDLHDLVRLLTEHPEWQAELRRLLLTDELLELPSLVRQLVEVQQRTEEQLASLTEAQKRSEEAHRRTEEQIAQLVETVAQLVEETRSLREWQRGESGRREGERYERNFVKRAALLFMGGQGGATDNPLVQQRLVQWLRPLLGERFLQPAEDPSLADIIWWKGDKVLIGEVSLKIDRHDVWRVLRWTQLLREAGVDVTPFVAGAEWATPEAQEMAEAYGVEWLMDSTPSEGLIAFRRLPDPATAPEPPPAG